MREGKDRRPCRQSRCRHAQRALAPHQCAPFRL